MSGHIFICVVYIMIKAVRLQDLMSVKVFILQVAVLNNYEHLVKILLDRGADPNIQNQVRTSYNQHQIAERSNGDGFHSRHFSWKRSSSSFAKNSIDSKNNWQENISFGVCLSLSLKFQLFLIKFFQRPNDLLYELCYTHTHCALC